MYNKEYDELISNGISNCLNNKDSREIQDMYLKLFMEEVRGVGLDILNGVNAVFIPNDDYLEYKFGPEVKNEDYDFYDSFGRCKYTKKVLIPIYDINDKIVATVGYDPYQTNLKKTIKELELKADKTEEELKELDDLRQQVGLKYVLPSKKRIKGSHYLYYPKGVFRKAMEENYIVVIDGIFDCIQLNHYGINATSLMGSEVSEVKLLQLGFIDNIFVAYDNDNSGLKVYETLRKKLPNVTPIKSRKTGDIDEYITKYGIGDLKERIEKMIDSKIKSPIILK